MKNKIDYTLYLVTDQKVLGEKNLYDSICKAVEGGVTIVQLREKDMDTCEFYAEALHIRQLLQTKQIPLIINDRVDVALAVDADGVHVGQSDLPAAVVRKMIGAHKILGVSVSTVKEAVQAERDGADYIGVGAMFPTATKTDAKIVSLSDLKAIRSAVHIPIVLIGGIGSQTIGQFPREFFDGAAVVSDILGKMNVKKAAEEIISAIQALK